MSDKYKKYNLKNGIDEEGYDRKGYKIGEKRRIGKTKVIIGILVIIVIVISLIINFCPTILWADISEYENDEILVSGLLEEDFYITPKELAKMKLTNVKATGRSAKAGTISGIGPTMEEFLSDYGKTVEDFKQVRFRASDDYSTVLVKTLHEKEVVLSIANGREPLNGEQRPLRIVIPNDDSGNWIRLVTRIEFTPN